MRRPAWPLALFSRDDAIENFVLLWRPPRGLGVWAFVCKFFAKVCVWSVAELSLSRTKRIERFFGPSLAISSRLKAMKKGFFSQRPVERFLKQGALSPGGDSTNSRQTATPMGEFRSVPRPEVKKAQLKARAHLLLLPCSTYTTNVLSLSLLLSRTETPACFCCSVTRS